MTKEITTLPKLSDLITDTDLTVKENQLMVLLNQPPPVEWLRDHPMIANYKYLPIERVEYLLTRIFTKWWIEVKNVQCIANSCVVTVRLFVVNPITGETEWQEGVGASPIQTNKGAGATDWQQVKADGVMKSVPAAKSFALKDAAECFGVLFGKNLARKDVIIYDSLLRSNGKPTIEDLQMLYDMKKESCTPEEIRDFDRILTENEVKSFTKMKTILNAK